MQVELQRLLECRGKAEAVRDAGHPEAIRGNKP
jgi:hypothetical protein